MNVSKLFGILVVGGSLLATSGCEQSSDPEQKDEKVVTGPDAADAPGAIDANTSDANTSDANASDADAQVSELAPCFCNSEACCERHEDGSGTIEEGFECCWSTTC